jgi:hypothetical protein
MTLSELKKTVRSYLAKDRSEDALHFMASALREEATIQRTITLQQGRLSRLRQDVIKGTIEKDNAGVDRTTINLAIDNMLEDIEAEDLLLANSFDNVPVISNISAEERKGIERAIALKVRIINALREKLAYEDDAIRTIKYEEQLQKAEADLKDLKEKLA